MLTSFYANALDVKLVTGDNKPPYSDRSLYMNGISSLLASKVMQESKTTYSISWRPWNRGLFETDTGVFDIAFPYSITRERVSKFYFSNPIYSINNVLIVPKSITDLRKYSSINTVKVCVPSHFSWSLLKKYSSSYRFQKVNANTEEDCTALIKEKKVDIILTSKIKAKHLLKLEKPLIDYKISGFSLNITNKYFLISKANPNAKKILRQINVSLEKLAARGTYQSLISNYPL